MALHIPDFATRCRGRPLIAAARTLRAAIFKVLVSPCRSLSETAEKRSEHFLFVAFVMSMHKMSCYKSMSVHRMSCESRLRWLRCAVYMIPEPPWTGVS